jgi:AmiR/NasT family two-component response regulator
MVILALNSPSLVGEQRLAPADDLVELINDLAEELARYLCKAASLTAELTLVRRINEELTIAVESNRSVGVAMGILMDRHRITEPQSFDLLKTASQAAHRKLRNIALDVIDTGQLEPHPTIKPRPGH